MKDITQLIEEVQNNPEFRAKFVGKDEAGIEKMLKDEGYDVTMEEVAEAAKNIDIELTPEELEKIAGGKTNDQKLLNIGSGATTIFVALGVGCFVVEGLQALTKHSF